MKLFTNPVLVAPGCLQCRIYEDTLETGTFLIVEEWETRKDLVRRLDTDQFKKLLRLIEISKTPPEIRCENIRNANGIESIESLLNGN